MAPTTDTPPPFACGDRVRLTDALHLGVVRPNPTCEASGFPDAGHFPAGTRVEVRHVGPKRSFCRAADGCVGWFPNEFLTPDTAN